MLWVLFSSPGRRGDRTSWEADLAAYREPRFLLEEVPLRAGRGEGVVREREREREREEREREEGRENERERKQISIILSLFKRFSSFPSEFV